MTEPTFDEALEAIVADILFSAAPPNRRQRRQRRIRRVGVTKTPRRMVKAARRKTDKAAATSRRKNRSPK
jgi:hypothetical protein